VEYDGFKINIPSRLLRLGRAITTVLLMLQTEALRVENLDEEKRFNITERLFNQDLQPLMTVATRCFKSFIKGELQLHMIKIAHAYVGMQTIEEI
jgi:hypothetical protein